MVASHLLVPETRGLSLVRGLVPANDDLPAGQKLVAEDEPIHLQRPATHPCAPELLNPHDERHVLRMATWKGDELTDDVQAHEAVFVDEPARNVAPDVARKARRVAMLVDAVEGPTGRAVNRA